MSVLDDATIIYVPGVYKTSAVALQKPISAGSVSSLTFARASTGTRVNSAGLIESVATNIPRIDFLNDTCGSQLLEPARTNLLTYSEQFDNAAWTKSNVTISANATTAPDGTTTADKIVGDAVSGSKIAFQSVTVTSSTVYSCSVFFKADEYSLAYVRFGGVTSQPYVVYDLSTQSIDAESGFTSTNIVDYGNGWYRIDVTATASGISIALNVSFAPSGYTIGAFNALEYTGDGSSGGFVWGAQIEAGAYPTSYIKTEASTVTRSAETISKTGLASLLGDSEGTIYFEGSFNESSAGNIRISISDGTDTEVVTFGINSGSLIAVAVQGGVATPVLTGGAITYGQTYKIALKYGASGTSLFVDGVEVDTAANAVSFTSGTLTNFQFSGGSNSAANNFYGNVKQLAVWDSALTDTELENLTT